MKSYAVQPLLQPSVRHASHIFEDLQLINMFYIQRRFSNEKTGGRHCGAKEKSWGKNINVSLAW